MKTNFTPGPSQLYFTVEDHAKRAFREGIPSISHRSKQFENIYASVKEGLASLLGLPDSYRVLFTSSATEIWERSIQNLVIETSHHFVNGAFSSRYFEIAQQLGKTASKTELKDGLGFNEPRIPAPAELIALTHNETSTGVSLTTEFIHAFRKTYRDAIIAVDAVSSLPYPDFHYDEVDSVFFSVQKAFGLPAGLGVWLVNERCLEKASSLQAKGNAIGTYHSLPSLAALERKNQTPETPNVLGIYLLSKILEDYNRRGITTIRRETEYKAAILYHAMDSNAKLKSFVSEPAHRSKTVLVADCGTNLPEIVTALQSKELFPGDGYGKFKSTQLRFANFPTHSKEQFELLVDTLAAL